MANIQVRELQGSVAVECRGELTSQAHEEEFKSSLLFALAAHPEQLYLDCTEVSKLSRRMGALLNETAGRCAELGMAFDLSIRADVLRTAESEEEVQQTLRLVDVNRWHAGRQEVR